MRIKYLNNSTARSLRLSKRWIVCLLLLAITAQSLAPGVVVCFAKGAESGVNLCSREKCCTNSNNAAKLFQSFNFRAVPLNKECGTCLKIPLYKSLTQNERAYEAFTNMFTFALSPHVHDTGDAGNRSAVKTFQLTAENLSRLSSIQNVVLQI